MGSHPAISNRISCSRVTNPDFLKTNRIPNIPTPPPRDVIVEEAGISPWTNRHRLTVAQHPETPELSIRPRKQ